MKPHEETWETYTSGIDNHGIYRKNPRRTVATRIGTHDEAMLLAAAPEMARALLECRRDDMHVACWCHQSRDILRYGHEDRCVLSLRALRKAGVLP